MRPAFFAAPAALLLALGCQRPEVEDLKQHPRPVVVEVQVPDTAPEPKAMAQDYGDALRARLATRVTVVPEGVQPPPDAVTLRVDFRRVYPIREGHNAAKVGVAVGVGIGALSLLNRDSWWAWDGFFWGWAAHDAVRDRDDQLSRLGCDPVGVDVEVHLNEAKDPEPLDVFSMDTWDIVPFMGPLSARDAEDPGRVREEQARALAYAVTRRLQEKFEWRAQAAPSYFGAAPRREEPAPAPAPADAPTPAVPAEAPAATPTPAEQPAPAPHDEHTPIQPLPQPLPEPQKS